MHMLYQNEINNLNIPLTKKFEGVIKTLSLKSPCFNGEFYQILRGELKPTLYRLSKIEEMRMLPVFFLGSHYYASTKAT